MEGLRLCCERDQAIGGSTQQGSIASTNSYPVKRGIRNGSFVHKRESTKIIMLKNNSTRNDIQCMITHKLCKRTLIKGTHSQVGTFCSLELPYSQTW